MRDDLPSEWDVVVVGAGAAGAMGALHLARARLRVLLVEKSAWPRHKACGGCVNAVALRTLAGAGLGLREGSACDRMRLACRRRTATFPLPAGIAISRQRLDALLVEHALIAGVRFLPQTRAALGEALRCGRRVVLRSGATQCTVTARVVLDCGGLATRLLPDTGWHVAPRSRIGVGASMPVAPAWLPQGTIHMACVENGYVGLVRAEHGTANIAAALDPAHCRAVGGPARAVAAILAEADSHAIEGLDRLGWCGTPALTRTRAGAGAARVLILGDAAGYVEPFTGEGIAWALEDAAAVCAYAAAGAAHWTDAVRAGWELRRARMARARQRACRGVARLMRHPNVVAAMLPLLDAAPALVAPLTSWLNVERPPAGATNG